MRLQDLYTEANKNRYDRNRAKGEMSLCDLCGRPLSERNAYVVENYKTGELVPVGYSLYESDHCIYLGPVCAKRPELREYIRYENVPTDASEYPPVGTPIVRQTMNHTVRRGRPITGRNGRCRTFYCTDEERHVLALGLDEYRTEKHRGEGALYYLTHDEYNRLSRIRGTGAKANKKPQSKPGS